MAPGSVPQRSATWAAVADPDAYRVTLESFEGPLDLLLVDLPPGAERTVAFRKLLESKDCAVRTLLF